MLNLEEIFKKHIKEYLEFKRVENKLNSRKDLHAFILLNDLLPSDGDMVSAAAHDQIWLSVGLDELAEVATEAQIIDLIRCGIRLDDDCLTMWV